MKKFVVFFLLCFMVFSCASAESSEFLENEALLIKQFSEKVSAKLGGGIVDVDFTRYETVEDGCLRPSKHFEYIQASIDYLDKIQKKTGATVKLFIEGKEFSSALHEACSGVIIKNFIIPRMGSSLSDLNRQYFSELGVRLFKNELPQGRKSMERFNDKEEFTKFFKARLAYEKEKYITFISQEFQKNLRIILDESFEVLKDFKQKKDQEINSVKERLEGQYIQLSARYQALQKDLELKAEELRAEKNTLKRVKKETEDVIAELSSEKERLTKELEKEKQNYAQELQKYQELAEAARRYGEGILKKKNREHEEALEKQSEYLDRKLSLLCEERDRYKEKLEKLELQQTRNENNFREEILRLKEKNRVLRSDGNNVKKIPFKKYIGYTVLLNAVISKFIDKDTEEASTLEEAFTNLEDYLLGNKIGKM